MTCFIYFKKLLKIIIKQTKRVTEQIVWSSYVDSKVKKNNSILFLPTVDWNAVLFQRPHHFANYLSNKGFDVYYGTLQIEKDVVEGILEIKKNLHLTNRFGVVALNKKCKYIYLTSTQQYTTTEDIVIYKNSGKKIIYDYIDKIDEKISGSRTTTSFIFERHRKILQNNLADVIMCSSMKLYEEIQGTTDSKIIYSPNGVDYKFFSHNFNNISADELEQIYASGKKIVGYYGALANWIDFDLLNQVSQILRDVQFILIGNKFDNKFDKYHFSLNVKYLGPKNYSQLPSYLRYFSAGIILFSDNEIAEATSPLKVYEYLAAGVPTVATKNLIECNDIEGVIMSTSEPATFARNIKNAINFSNQKRRKISQNAKKYDWENSFSEINCLLDK